MASRVLPAGTGGGDSAEQRRQGLGLRLGVTRVETFDELGAKSRAAALEREDHRNRHLPLAQIVADRFAQLGFARGHVEQVVEHLKRDPEVESEVAQRFDAQRGGAGCQRAAFGRSGEQRRRLLDDDLGVTREREVEVAERAQLQYLAVGDVG